MSNKSVSIPCDGVYLDGELDNPGNPRGVVVFAHGSGSSRHSPRNRFVAEKLRAEGFATLLFDLLTAEEDQNYATRFDIDLLAQRLVAAVKWLRSQREVEGLGIGLFGASTGAAAALKASVALQPEIAAVVSRGGRPDLAGGALGRVSSPTLMIVGGSDREVLQLNHEASAAMPDATTKRLSVVPGATHLFEEPGTLEAATDLAREWFEAHVAQPAMR
jgi:putative phosphoribosyl transferase